MSFKKVDKLLSNVLSSFLRNFLRHLDLVYFPCRWGFVIVTFDLFYLSSLFAPLDLLLYLIHDRDEGIFDVVGFKVEFLAYFHFQGLNLWYLFLNTLLLLFKGVFELGFNIFCLLVDKLHMIKCWHL